jgi:hypothetical protein
MEPAPPPPCSSCIVYLGSWRNGCMVHFHSIAEVRIRFLPPPLPATFLHHGFIPPPPSPPFTTRDGEVIKAKYIMLSSKNNTKCVAKFLQPGKRAGYLMPSSSDAIVIWSYDHLMSSSFHVTIIWCHHLVIPLSWRCQHHLTSSSSDATIIGYHRFLGIYLSVHIYVVYH